MQDRCIHRYPALYGSDDRIQACMAELGVPLTHHPGFHQFDVYGNLLGLLAAHPIAPLLTLHHLDVVETIFPDSRTQAAALRRLFDGPVRPSIPPGDATVDLLRRRATLDGVGVGGSSYRWWGG
ncbi:hypothetical protein HPP92_003087 [Vanilla planifolia]|uniref:Uncharacterized protein n=1 Tax=Vanilla planifolia TaxID=51239 RepID=A0A835S2D3_VANPL|nr:hypothetical protein HPP92_003087 [Vanilla planifolia]